MHDGGADEWEEVRTTHGSTSGFWSLHFLEHCDDDRAWSAGEETDHEDKDDDENVVDLFALVDEHEGNRDKNLAEGSDDNDPLPGLEGLGHEGEDWGTKNPGKVDEDENVGGFLLGEVEDFTEVWAAPHG